MVKATIPFRFFRFSVGSLLVVITVVAICFGFARWNRRQTFANYRQVYDEGVGLIMVEDHRAGRHALDLESIGRAIPEQPRFT